ncbi:lipoyl domain-containing protein [Rapidithrix thailandica]|uniref:Lipoyl domain-containing protein n=1 Tax=Rapidithrix thailandica TaxID=413964 RepID=A0AAW9S1R2_9BACT
MFKKLKELLWKQPGKIPTQSTREPEWYSNEKINALMETEPGIEAVKVPALNPEMKYVILQKWYIKEGQKVAQGEVIADLETDKAVFEITTETEGYIYALAPSGKRIHVETLLAIISQKPLDRKKWA